MKTATLTIELNGKEFVKHNYKYRSVNAITKRLNGLIKYYKTIPHLTNANFKTTI